MLSPLGFGMVVAFMTLIMTRRLLPIVALIVVPVAFGLAAGFGAGELGRMMLDGLRTLAPTAVMLMFAILYFGIMIDAGLFDPIVRRILGAVRGDPLRVVVGTALLASFVSLDGDGSTTYMITCAAMLPLYRRLRIDLLALTCVTMLAGGVMNLTPWGGPLARAASALHVDPAEVFVPMIPSMVAGIAGVVLLAWILGRRERARLGVLSWDAAAPAGPVAAAPAAPGPSADGDALSDEIARLRRPRLLAFNALLTLALMTSLVAGVLPLPALFMLGFSIAIVANYPSLVEQRARIAAHAPNVLAVVSVIFAAGIFTGILGGTGMVDAMSKSFLGIVPPSLGPYLATIAALASLPFTFFISNDAFYFGVLPIVADAAQAYGITAVEMARASLIGQPVHLLSPLVPSTYLLVGLAGVEFGDHQRYTIKWAVLVCLLMLAASLALGLFPLARPA
jgi:CitMHS family citrate-Mg2+:H+ or citrate-Ca2+:H+ symporter